MIPDSPYKGLVPFEDSELDALLFFGRERESGLISANVLAARLTVLYGPSGVGKSSVLGAGVAHRLRRQAQANVEERGHPEFVVVVFDAWSEDPAGSLRAAVRAELAAQFGSALLDELEDESLADTFGRWTQALACDLLLILDQAEEYFLYHGEETGFARELPELVTRPGLRVRVLLALRDDALAKLDRFKGRIPNLFANYMRLDHLERSSARLAITKPVERYNEVTGQSIEIEPALIEAVLDQTAAGKVDLGDAGRGLAAGETDEGRIEAPYLQLVLERIWEDEREAGSSLLRDATLVRLGGAEAIVRTHLHRAVEALSSDEKDLAADVFRYLVTPSGAKVAHGVGDLADYASVDERRLLPVLSTLGRERIVRPVDAADGDGARYEIFHDVLGDAVLAWRRERELERGRRTAERRTRRLALLAGGALVALFLMTGLTAYAFSQRSEARKQTAEAGVLRGEAVRLAAQKQQLLDAAQAARNDAQQKAQEARDQARRAKRQRQRAEDLTQRAVELRLEAKKQEARAKSGEKEAVQLREAADLATSAAVRQKHVAVKAKRKALSKAKQARAANRRAQANELVAQSVAALATDPEKSTALAVQASRLERGSSKAENVLREALVAMRVQHILPGAGIASVAHFSRNGRRIVVGGGSKKLRIYRANGSPVRTVRATVRLNDAAISSDGSLVAGGGADGRVWLWNVNTGALRHLEHEAPVSGVAWSPQGNVLVSVGSGANPSARLWDGQTGERLHLLVHPRPLNAAVFSPDGRRLVTYGEGKIARVFDVGTGVLLSTLEAATGGVTSAAFSPGGDFVVTGHADKTARLWDAETGNLQKTFAAPHTGQVVDVAFSSDGKRVVTASLDTVARLWNAANGVLADALRGHVEAVNDVDFAPEGYAVVTASADDTARYWASGQQPVQLLGHKGDVLGASFRPGDGSSILTASEDGFARLWDPYGEPPLRVFARAVPAVRAVAVNPSGSLVAIGRQDGSVQVLTTDRRVPTDRRVRSTFSLGSRKVVSVAWTIDGTLLAASANGHVQIREDSGRQPLYELDHGGPINAAAISRDGTLAATAGRDGNVRLWRLPGGTPLSVLDHDGPVTSVAIDPAARTIASGSGQIAYLWPVTGGEPKELKGHTELVTGVAFGARGRLLATSSNDSDARLWDTRTGKLVKRLSGHMGDVVGVAFSADGRWLATAGPRKAAVWQVGENDLPRSFLFFLSPPTRAEQNTLSSVAFSSRNWTIVTGSEDGTVRTYKCLFCGQLKQLVPYATARLARLKAEASRGRSRR